ncbi:MAG: V-type ATP synthase subunit K [Clostridia bacterium]|jgi:V/A-type H+-transporting ATPase subunit K|nr:V-type ATP synthase subunit K [Clostridia bacterium]MBO7399961.1 V-type ATP synthase subunit K [Clostridia bacterium]MBO7549443.1 V-type ATP synthase subunit K [Clostridia bacterium]MBO7666230.1 V-type ATP synthase subunit K [Clostridia bacterium]MBP5238932.1 V-type ATP synthase subunit K [Clostridia bacterium]
MDFISITKVLLDETVGALPEVAETASAISGNVIAYIGAALCAILAGCGSALGVMAAGKAAAGVASEKPELFGKLLVLQALPGTQGIYGFLTAILVLIQFNGLGSDAATLTVTQGWQLFFAAVPMAIVGLTSGIAQGKAAVAAIHMTGKQPDASGKGITMTALVETYAILALLISILLIRGVAVG